MENKYQFNTEVGKILQLMIHSLYTNKDIFLRELISNSSDAIDKLRYLSITNPELSKDDHNYKISIETNEKDGTFTITDNGIGMDKEDLINNLGTIARSGTQNFMEQLTGDAKKDNQLIGQFGVGFYSAFMVAEKVVVQSKKAGSNEAFEWESKGDGEFIIRDTQDFSQRGTKITLHINNESREYLDKFRISHIVKTYSDHISTPISLINETGQEEILNSSSAIWTRNKSEITEEDYNKFYKSVSFQVDEPWMTLHNKNEGLVEFTNLLYIPSKKPFDLFHPDRLSRIKLYIKKVFISESVELVPAHLRFLRGVVDSQDLPLNISRETLQHNIVIDKIKRAIIKRVLSELKKKAESDFENYKIFWENFGAVLKEGLCEAGEFRNDILEVCRFHTTNSEELTSLNEYISRMKENQKTIFYLTGPSLDALKKSPQLEGFKAKNIEVLLFTDHVDEFWVNVVNEFKELPLKSITRTDINLEEFANEEQNKEEEKENNDSFENLVGHIANLLKNRIKEVKISKKLTESPACISVAEGMMDIRMERFLLEQKQIPTASLKIFEINPNHPIIKQLASKNELSTQDEMLIKVIYDQACIVEGEPVLDASEFSHNLSKLLTTAYS